MVIMGQFFDDEDAVPSRVRDASNHRRRLRDDGSGTSRRDDWLFDDYMRSSEWGDRQLDLILRILGIAVTAAIALITVLVRARLFPSWTYWLAPSILVVIY